MTKPAILPDLPSPGAARVVWDEKCPRELRSAVEPLLDRWLHLLPTWCHSLVVAYDSECDDVANCLAEHEYRGARITIGGNWLRQPTYERESIIVHELLHVPLVVLTEWTKDLVHRLVGDDERLRDWLLSEWQERFEAVTCDLEHSIGCAPYS